MTTKTLLLVASIALGAGCVPKETMKTGPKIGVTLDPTGFSSAAHDDDTDPHLTLDTTTNTYEFMLIVDTIAGEIEMMGSFDRVPVVEIEGTITIPGVTIPESTVDVTGTTDRTFTRHDPILLQATAKGQSLTIHQVGFDENGLQSNIIDFIVALR